MRKISSLKRTHSSKNEKIKFTLFTEGRNTEPEYFKAIVGYNPDILIDLQIYRGVGCPMTIAEKASSFVKNSRPRNGDSVWAVFDRDDHPKFNDACTKCKSVNINTAISDPCFEIWLILHYEDYNKADDRHKVQRYFSTLCNKYNKNSGKIPDCKKIVESVIEAENRAQKQYEKRLQESDTDTPKRPYTTVHNLTKAMREVKV